jgi:hypothetical protein
MIADIQYIGNVLIYTPTTLVWCCVGYHVKFEDPEKGTGVPVALAHNQCRVLVYVDVVSSCDSYS